GDEVEGAEDGVVDEPGVGEARRLVGAAELDRRAARLGRLEDAVLDHQPAAAAVGAVGGVGEQADVLAAVVHDAVEGDVLRVVEGGAVDVGGRARGRGGVRRRVGNPTP